MLRGLILVHACGIVAKYLFSEFEVDSSIWSLLAFDLKLPETTADFVDASGHWLFLGSAIALLVLPLFQRSSSENSSNKINIVLQIILLSFIVFWPFAMAAAKSIRHVYEFPESYTLASHGARYLLPLALIALLLSKDNLAIWLLRIGSSLTFLFHGLAAIYQKGSFVDLLLNSSQTLLSWDMPESTAKTLLYLIGAIDVAVALLILLEKSRFVAGYMASWGLITAISRMTAGGITQYPELLIRAAHFGAPLVLLLYWQFQTVSCRPPQPESEPTHDSPPVESNQT